MKRLWLVLVVVVVFLLLGSWGAVLMKQRNAAPGAEIPVIIDGSVDVDEEFLKSLDAIGQCYLQHFDDREQFVAVYSSLVEPGVDGREAAEIEYQLLAGRMGTARPVSVRLRRVHGSEERATTLHQMRQRSLLLIPSVMPLDSQWTKVEGQWYLKIDPERLRQAKDALAGEEP